MNSDDRKALAAFKGMFTALSTSVRKKFEGKKDVDTGSRPHSEAKDHPVLRRNQILDDIGFVPKAGRGIDLSTPPDVDFVAAPFPRDEPPALRSEALRQSGTNVVPFGGKPST